MWLASVVHAENARRCEIGAAIVAGYERLPQTASETGWSDEMTRAMIAEEPW